MAWIVMALISFIKELPVKFWHYIFKLLLDSKSYNSNAHRIRTLLIIGSVLIISVIAVMNYVQIDNQSSISKFINNSIVYIGAKNSFYGSVKKEIKSCGAGIYTGKINFAKMTNGDYVFIFESLLNDKGQDVKEFTPEASKLYGSQYRINPMTDIADMALVMQSVHGKTYKITPDEMRYMGSTVFRQLFDRAILQFKYIYYKPFYYQDGNDKMLLYVYTVSVVKGYEPMCDPEDTLNNIFKYGIIYHDDLMNGM